MSYKSALENENPNQSSAKVIRRKATLKQRKFAEEYLNNGGNATKAATVAYNTSNDNSAASIGTELLRKPAVLALLNKHEEAAELVVLDTMMNAPEYKDRLAGAKLLLAYTRGNPVSRNENVNVNISLEDILSS
jgi:phage terminase small subunit